MWLQVSFAVVVAYACAQDNLDAETKQRLFDIFGELNYDDGEDSMNDTSAGNDTDCICVSYSRCKVTNESFYGDGDLEVRHMSCPNPFDWCCDPRRVRAAALPARVGCGWAGNEHGEGGVAAFGEFPWVVAILHKSAGKAWSPSEYVGGGSIIHPSVILTAAHKFAGQDHTKLKCRAGEWNSSSVSEPLPHQDRSIARIIKHEGYYRRFLSNSIALILLTTPFDLRQTYPHMGTACVGLGLPPPGTRCYATGWGKQKHGAQGQYRKVLKKVEVPLVDKVECESLMRATRLGKQFKLHASQMCAGGAGADTCTGDGGAPLVCRVGNSGRYAVFGMAAWGLGCGGSLPGVYVNVPQFQHWIGDVLAAQRYSTTYYQYEAAVGEEYTGSQQITFRG